MYVSYDTFLTGKDPDRREHYLYIFGYDGNEIDEVIATVKTRIPSVPDGCRRVLVSVERSPVRTATLDKLWVRIKVVDEQVMFGEASVNDVLPDVIANIGGYL